MKAWIAVAAALALSACTSTQPPAAPPPPVNTGGNTPVTLSDADRAAIEAGTRAALGGGANATFRTMIATRGGDGVVTACGYVNTGSGDRPYIGVLGAAGFSVTSISSTKDEIIAVQGACSKKGVHI
jgi:hypothetical protein